MEKGREARVGSARRMRYERAIQCVRFCALVMAIVALTIASRGRALAQGTESGQPSPQDKPEVTQELPDAPEQPKDANPNPVQAVEDKTRQAAEMTKDAATTGLLKARDWESGWITGVYVGKNRKLVPLTAQQRRDYYLKQTLTTPEAYMKRMFAAAIDQARDTPWQWGSEWGGYGKRFASREGQFITANSLAALGNAKLGYEVRYDKCKCDGFWPRTRHAFMRNLLTYDRSEEQLHPQWALYGGAFSGGALSTTWKPGSHNFAAEGLQAMAEQVGWGTLLNFFTEFSREINRKQGVK